MPRIKSDFEKVRLNVEMPQSARDALCVLRARMLADSLSEVIRINTVSATNMLALIDEGCEITATKGDTQTSLQLLFLPAKEVVASALPSSSEKVRYNLEMQKPVRDALEALKKRMSAAALSEVIRSNTVSVTNLLALIDEGYEIIATKGDTQKSLQLLFFPPKAIVDPVPPSSKAEGTKKRSKKK